jgi:membrane-associated protease RseP (regulator of RpoE activity)
MDERDLDDITAALKECKAAMVKFFVRGYTDRHTGRYSNSYSNNNASLHSSRYSEINISCYQGRLDDLSELEQQHSFLSRQAYLLSKKYVIPVIVEPPLISDLACKIEGIMENSPAEKAGLKPGDIITQVDGTQVISRVDAFNTVYRRTDPVLSIIRADKSHENKNKPFRAEGKELVLNVKLVKKRNTSPGFVVYYDIAPEVAEKVRSVAKNQNANSVLVITSELALPAINRLFEVTLPELTKDLNVHPLAVKNAYFGGTIKCAGLLTVQDIIPAVEQHLLTGPQPDLILLPPVMFDFKGKDLLGKTLADIAEKIKIPVQIPE